MPRKASWEPRKPMLPPASGPDPDDELAASGRTWDRSRVIGADLDHVVLHDLTVTGCDIVAVIVRAGSGRRITVTGSRMRDVSIQGGRLQDISIANTHTEGLSLRFCQLESVAFVDCSLAGADFTGVSFDHVTFLRCDLTAAKLDTATVKALRTSKVNFTDITGAAALRGASIAPEDLLSLAAPLAHDVGIRLIDEVDGYGRLTRR